MPQPTAETHQNPARHLHRHSRESGNPAGRLDANNDSKFKPLYPRANGNDARLPPNIQENHKIPSPSGGGLGWGRPPSPLPNPTAIQPENPAAPIPMTLTSCQPRMHPPNIIPVKPKQQPGQPANRHHPPAKPKMTENGRKWGEIKKILNPPEANPLCWNPKPFRRPVKPKQQPASPQTVPTRPPSQNVQKCPINQKKSCPPGGEPPMREPQSLPQTCKAQTTTAQPTNRPQPAHQAKND